MLFQNLFFVLAAASNAHCLLVPPSPSSSPATTTTDPTSPEYHPQDVEHRSPAESAAPLVARTSVTSYGAIQAGQEMSVQAGVRLRIDGVNYAYQSPPQPINGDVMSDINSGAAELAQRTYEPVFSKYILASATPLKVQIEWQGGYAISLTQAEWYVLLVATYRAMDMYRAGAARVSVSGNGQSILVFTLAVS
ncbi:hypothetical protein F4778DRAFT_741949 [Xylariomycetidae sp. FL2044]|nr:hypothetical protein F4778DRAFT_741949 [Xylariomycetidae sp. FL2044]